MADETRMRRLLCDTHGLSTVEYVIVLALIAAVAVGSWRVFGDEILHHLGRGSTSVRDHLTIGKDP